MSESHTYQVHQALEAHLSPEVADAIRHVASVAHSHGTSAWLVGGLVRDAILGAKSQHQVPDIAVGGDVYAIAKACLHYNRHSEFLARSQFQTCRIKISGQVVELATARSDTYKPHGSLPTIAPVRHIIDDLPRRDYSVNAMAVELNPDGYGEFYDPFGGLEDCANSKLRMLHPDSFSEDPTRILRGIRFAARYNLRFEPHTASSLVSALPALTAFLANSPNRLFAEFTRWFEPSENLHNIVIVAHELGVLQALQMAPSHAEHVAALSQLTDSHDADNRFAMFLQTLSNRALRSVSQNMPLTKRWRALVDDTVRFRRALETTDWDTLADSEVAAKLRGIDESVVWAATAILGNRHFAARLRRIDRAARQTVPLVDGSEVAKLGIPPGREIGNTLMEIIDRRIDGQIATREDEVEYIQSRANRRQPG